MSSWRQLRRDSVQRCRLPASNPIRIAIKKSANRTEPRPAPSAIKPSSSTTVTATQPISASHSRCQSSQIGLATAAQK
jgi:hypothetical protein